MKRPKIRYEVDPQNRLVVFRKVLDGEFNIGKDNSLAYHLKKSAEHGLPQQIKFTGAWSLNKDHSLTFTLDKWNNQCEGNKLIIDCSIISAQAGELVVSLISRDSSGKGHFYLLKLSGRWQADEYNRLVFNITRENLPAQQLIFSGSWELDKRNKLTYSYSRKDLKKKRKITQEFSFEGYWDIADKRRITYVLSRRLGSQFDFKISFDKLLPNAIQYRLGLGSSGEKKVLKIFGSWRVNKRLNVYFEAEPKGEHSMLLGGSFRIGEGHLIEVALSNSAKKDLGIEARLSRRFFKGSGEAFIKAAASKQEKAISAGVGALW